MPRFFLLSPAQKMKRHFEETFKIWILNGLRMVRLHLKSSVDQIYQSARPRLACWENVHLKRVLYMSAANKSPIKQVSQDFTLSTVWFPAILVIPSWWCGRH